MSMPKIIMDILLCIVHAGQAVFQNMYVVVETKGSQGFSMKKKMKKISSFAAKIQICLKVPKIRLL